MGKWMIREHLWQLKQAVSDVFFPRVCSICETADLVSGESLCKDCLDSLREVSGSICAQCGKPVPGVSAEPGGRCGTCLTHPPPYDRARYGFFYEGRLREALIRFKFYGGLHLGPTLSEILVRTFPRYFQSDDFDVILPIPIHTKRLIDRGFNQASILAQKLSAAVGLPMNRTCLAKIKDTLPQTRLSGKERLKNLKGSFGIVRPERVRGCRVLVLDDVATTGSTLAEAAKTVLAAGASRVDALALALRSRDSQDPGS